MGKRSFIFACFSFKMHSDINVCCSSHHVALTKCESQLADYAANPLPGAFTPRCTSDGNFEAQQCHGSVCYCVNKNGIPIHGTEVKIGRGRPDCKDPG